MKDVRLFISLLMLLLSVSAGLAVAATPEIEQDPAVLKSKFKKMEQKASQNRVNLNQTNTNASSSQSEPSQPFTLQGSVTTLEQAIQDEKGTVDWYGWYMGARNYIANNGGIKCALGTPIVFYKDGEIAAQSFDAFCLASVSRLHYPLPANTKLTAVKLPTRSGKGAPASPEELQRYTGGE